MQYSTARHATIINAASTTKNTTFTVFIPYSANICIVFFAMIVQMSETQTCLMFYNERSLSSHNHFAMIVQASETQSLLWNFTANAAYLRRVFFAMIVQASETQTCLMFYNERSLSSQGLPCKFKKMFSHTKQIRE